MNTLGEKVTRSLWAASRMRAASAISSGSGARRTSKGSERGTEAMAAQATRHHAPHQILIGATLDSVRECHCQLCGSMPATDPLAGHVAGRGWGVVSVPAEG